MPKLASRFRMNKAFAEAAHRAKDAFDTIEKPLSKRELFSIDVDLLHS